MASPVVEQVVENSTNSAGTAHTINLPTATAGHLLLILLDKGSTAATVNSHASLTELLDENQANGLYIAYRQMDGTEPSSYILNTSASTKTASLAYRISGHLTPTVQAPQIGTTSSGTSTTPDPPTSASPGSTKDYLFITFFGAAGEEADDDTWVNSPPTNYTPSTPRQKSCGTAGTNLGGMIGAAERALNTGSAQDPGTFSQDANAAWRAQTVMITPAEPQTVTPSTLALTVALFAATVSTTANVTVTPSTAALTTTRFAPTVATPRLVAPGPASLAVSTFAPSVATPRLVAPAQALVSISGNAPTVATPRLVLPGAASLTVTGFAPTVTVAQGDIEVTPSSLGLSVTGLAPTVSLSNNQVVAPSATSVSLSFFAPSVAIAEAGDTELDASGDHTLILLGDGDSALGLSATGDSTLALSVSGEADF